MGRRKDLKGRRFGRLVVQHFDEAPRTHAAAKWVCLCDCGRRISARADVLQVGRVASCGCLARDVHAESAVLVGKANATHSNTIGGRYSPTYTSWMAMRQRCNDKGNINYANYGGRGIAVCDRWASFENFLVDMGERPEGMTLDRFPDQNGNYEPSNCRWATMQEQQSNRRDNMMIEVDGKTQTLTQWSREAGLDPRLVSVRIRKLGWDAKRALNMEAA